MKLKDLKVTAVTRHKRCKSLRNGVRLWLC